MKMKRKSKRTTKCEFRETMFRFIFQRHDDKRRVNIAYTVKQWVTMISTWKAGGGG